MGSKLRNEIVNQLQEDFLKRMMSVESYSKEDSEPVTIKDLKYIILQLAEDSESMSAMWTSRFHVDGLVKEFQERAEREGLSWQ